MAKSDDLNTPAIALVGFISALLFFAIIILLQVMFYQIESRQRAEDLRQPPAELTALVQRQQAALADFRWIEQKKGVVAIPIERAMELTVADLSKPPAAKDGKEGGNELAR
jgi:hypothetical protein